MGLTELNPRRLFALVCLLAGTSISGFGQQPAQPQQAAKPNEKKDQKQEPKKEPAPLFGGKLGIKSSSNTKETATMGFNGIDPSGKVDAKMLATTPSAEHEAKAKQLAAMVPNSADLAAFLKEGGLKSK